jgi:hypothetical protein
MIEPPSREEAPIKAIRRAAASGKTTKDAYSADASAADVGAVFTSLLNALPAGSLSDPVAAGDRSAHRPSRKWDFTA